jgi:ParB-like nuclease domain
MSDSDPGLDGLRLPDEAPIPPVREGLPPRYRMRADAHYVEQLDSTLFSSPIRFLEVRSIDLPRQDDEVAPSSAFVESIRRYGVLQPLLIRSRGGRHQVIAGRKRLAAALTAGLKTVPCLVERVDDDQAPVLAAASNTPSTDGMAARSPIPAPSTDVAFAAFADCLTAVASSANLLSPGQTLAHAVAVDLVRAEASRALQLLVAARVLKNEVSPRRRASAVKSILDRAADQTASERRLRGITLEVGSAGAGPKSVLGDEELLVAALGSLVLAVPALFDASISRAVSLRAMPGPDESVALTVVHEGAELPHYWRSRLAESEWNAQSMQPGQVTTAAFVLLRSSRRIAELHGGYMSLDCSEGRTNISIVIPAGRT